MKPESIAYLSTIRHCTDDINIHQLLDTVIELEASDTPIMQSGYTLSRINYMTHYDDLSLIQFVECDAGANIGSYMGTDYVVPVFGGHKDYCRFDNDIDDEFTKTHPYVLFWKGNDDSSYYRRFKNKAHAVEFLKIHQFFDPYDHTLYLGHN